jgi:hypothetical protein
MSDLLQTVFMIMVRPYYVNLEGNKVFYTGEIFGTYARTGVTDEHIALVTNNTTGSDISPTKVNAEASYLKDPWFLHSTYTSYWKMRDELKSIIAIYGTDNVKVASYIPVDFEVLPNQ